MGPHGDDVQAAHDRQRFARMTGETLHPDVGAEDAGRVSRGAEEFIMLRAAEGEVADHLGRHR